jgi:hypothetical protein
MLYMCASVRGILRQLEGVLTADPAIRDGVITILRDCVVELLDALDIFPNEKVLWVLRWIYENILMANVGFVAIYEPKEEIKGD